MWLRIDGAMINLENVAEVSWEASDQNKDFYGVVAFFGPDGKGLDTAYYKTKQGYEKALSTIQRYIAIDLTEKADESIQDTV